MRTTQLYIEIMYKDSDSISIPYIKQNNVWVALDKNIYYKINNKWSLLDISHFEKNNKFLVREV